MMGMADRATSRSVELVYDLMRHIFRGLSQHQEEAWLHTDLSMAQIKAFFTISRDGDPSIGVIAKELHVGLSAASQIVDRLVKAGLIERRAHPYDRRVTQCVLSVQGERLRDSFQTGPQLMRNWLEQLTPDELASLKIGLQALARQADQEGHTSNG